MWLSIAPMRSAAKGVVQPTTKSPITNQTNKSAYYVTKKKLKRITKREDCPSCKTLYQRQQENIDYGE